MEQKISTEEGKTLRLNRSIQAEGVFAYTKTGLQFRCFMLHGTEKVGAEWSLLAMAYNILLFSTIRGRGAASICTWHFETAPFFPLTG